MADYDAIIVGGGIIGCTLARSLAAAGMRVAVIERGAPGQEASSAAAGMLSPSAEAEKGSPLFTLCRESLLRYRPLAADLLSETGIDPQYRTEGTLLLFENEQERQAMLPSIEWQQSLGIPIQELPQQELREREPRLADPAGGFYLPEDHQIDNRLLLQALVQSCRQRGVEFILGKSVLEVECNGHGVTGVIVEDGRLAARRVVNTAGAWAGMIRVPGLPSAPIRPVKGHIVVLESAAEPFQHVVRSHRAYMVPRRGGRVIVGSTMEEAGFDKAPRAAPLTRLLQAAQQMCPILEQSKVADLWAGLRPAAPDGLPLLGPTAVQGYFVALGHFRNGILLAPITAEILSGWLLQGKSPLPTDALLPRRFAQFLCG
ncbi:MAG: glycine oxidase ThiO [Acidobacteria bacterium]|nr:glycine oxidase ThiO [Acidobacteriota bacterium]